MTPFTINVATTAGQFRFKFDSQNGVAHCVQFKNSLSALTWQTLSTLSGDGTRKQVATVSPPLKSSSTSPASSLQVCGSTYPKSHLPAGRTDLPRLPVPA